MRNRQANGLSKSGRYKSEDTARLKYMHCTGFPLIQKGLLPLPHDIHMLELGPLDTKVFFWDMESVTYVTGQGTNEQRRSLVQVCVSNKLTVLFHVGTWSTMFASYQTSDTRGCGWSIS